MYQKLQKSTVEHKTIWQCESSLASPYVQRLRGALCCGRWLGWRQSAGIAAAPLRSAGIAAAAMLFNALIAPCGIVPFLSIWGMNEWIRRTVSQ